MSKFDSDLAERLYMESYPDEECGSVSELGWHGLFREEQAILSEDSQGFVYLDTFDSEEELEEAWAGVEKEYEEFYREELEEAGQIS